MESEMGVGRTQGQEMWSSPDSAPHLPGALGKVSSELG